MQTPFIVVHFTTIPPRFPYLQYTIQSWLEQSVQPDKIVISIRETYKNFGKLQHIERIGIEMYKKLSDKIVIQFLDGKDHGPNDKIIGALTFYNNLKLHSKLSPKLDSIYTIICDDDLSYHKDTIKSYMSEPELFSSKIIYTHFMDNKERLPGIRHLQGADTYLLPPLFFKHTTVIDYLEFLDKSMKECPDIFYQDDYMISYYASIICKFLIQGVKKPCMYNNVHYIEELHQNPLVHEREKNTVNYLTKALSQRGDPSHCDGVASPQS